VINKVFCDAVLSDYYREIFSICLEILLIFLLNFLNSLIFLSLNTPIRKRKLSFTVVYTVNEIDGICLFLDVDLSRPL